MTAAEIETYRLVVRGAAITLEAMVEDEKRLAFILDKRLETLRSIMQQIEALEIACNNAGMPIDA